MPTIDKPFGATGRSVPAIGQGTWDLPQAGTARAEAIRSLRTGIELGLAHIDTAEMYGSGAVEEMLGEALAGVPRDSLFLTGKVLPSNASHAGTMAACERSLKRLRTDHFDLYLLHWPGSYPIAETMGALETLVEQGKTRFIGVSNFDLEDLRAAQSCLRAVRLSANQVLYHVRERAIEVRLLPYCRQEQIALVGYTPFGRGRFPRNETRNGKLLERIGAKYGKTPRQVILAFLTRGTQLFAIPKASSSDHVRENAGGAGWDLQAEDAAAIDAAFPVNDGPLATL